MLSYSQTVEREFLQARFLVAELAATLDRLEEAAARDRTSGGSTNVAADPQLQPLFKAIQVVAQPSAAPNRAERILLLYSGHDA